MFIEMPGKLFDYPSSLTLFGLILLQCVCLSLSSEKDDRLKLSLALSADETDRISVGRKENKEEKSNRQIRERSAGPILKRKVEIGTKNSNIFEQSKQTSGIFLLISFHILWK